MCFIPGMQGLGVSMAVGGAVGLVMNAVESQFAQMIGAVGSVVNGYGAINAGCNLISLGGWAFVAGVGLALLGIGTMAFGANEMVAALSGTNYIQNWTGMNEEAYSRAYNIIKPSVMNRSPSNRQMKKQGIISPGSQK